MDAQQFVALQDELWSAFGFALTWWMIIFSAAGIFLAAMIFFLSIIRTWLDENS